MTLIAAFKCSDGFVLCADSQETVGPYRVTRQKIAPKDCGNFQLAIGGTGNGDVIDALVDRLETAVAKSALTDVSGLPSLLRSEALDFQKHEAQGYSKKDRAVELIVSARSVSLGVAETWRMIASRALPVDKFSLVGWGIPVYEHTVQRLYRPALTIPQALILGLYVFALAGKTSNYIGGPTTVVIGKPNGLWLVAPDEISDLAARVEKLSAHVDRLLLLAPDISITTQKFKEELDAFEKTAIDVRKADFQATVQRIVNRGLPTADDAYPRIPPGTTVMIGGPKGTEIKGFESPEDVIKDGEDES